MGLHLAGRIGAIMDEWTATEKSGEQAAPGAGVNIISPTDCQIVNGDNIEVNIFLSGAQSGDAAESRHIPDISEAVDLARSALDSVRSRAQSTCSERHS